MQAFIECSVVVWVMQGILILVEAERIRERLPELLQLATFVTSSAAYPLVSFAAIILIDNSFSICQGAC